MVSQSIQSVFANVFFNVNIWLSEVYRIRSISQSLTQGYMDQILVEICEIKSMVYVSHIFWIKMANIIKIDFIVYGFYD